MYSAIPTVDISGPRAALQRQRRKYGSLTGQVGVIELSKIPRDIWARVALSNLILHIYFGQGDVEQQPSNSRSYLRYWAYRIYIYIYRWMVERYGYTFIFPRAGAGDYLWNLIFFSFFFSPSTLLKDIWILLSNKPTFYFWTYFLFKHLFGFP